MSNIKITNYIARARQTLPLDTSNKLSQLRYSVSDTKITMEAINLDLFLT